MIDFTFQVSPHNIPIMDSPSGVDATKNVSAILLTIVFLWSASLQYREFLKESTGTLLHHQSIPNMDFPAVTICDKHFQFRKAVEERDIFVGPFQKPKEIATNILDAERVLKDRYHIVPRLWKYQFTLDDILRPERGQFSEIMYCRVGTVSCSFPEKGSKFAPSEHDNETEYFEMHVAAGTWTSRLMADSDKGATFMCHTLQPNVTVDFSRPNGRSIAISWKDDLAMVSPYWQIYIHDKHEHVLLDSYAIKSLPKLTAMQRNGGLFDSIQEWAKIKKKSTNCSTAS